MNGQTAAEGLFFWHPVPPGVDTVGELAEERRILLIRSRDRGRTAQAKSQIHKVV